MNGARDFSALKNYIKEDKVFGPRDASKIKDEKVISYLFDAHNKIYQEMQKKPSVIIGRKGTGKTSFLKCTTIDKDYRIVVELKTWDAFSKIVGTIEDMASSVIFVEEVAEIWDAVFWTSILADFVKIDEIEDDETKRVKSFLNKLGVDNEMTSDSIMTTFVSVLQKHGEKKTFGIVADLFSKLIFEDMNFLKAKETALNIMKKRNIKAVVLMDSIENYPIEIENFSHAISGLLKCLGAFHVPGFPNEVRCCLPAELYHRFLDISSNPIKDFQNHLTLHWHAGELIKVAANRLKLYFSIYDVEFYEDIKKFNLETREGCLEFFECIFPNTIVNRLGSIESPNAYILRHTQLNPRHLIHILNSVFYHNKRTGASPRKVTAECLKEGVYHVEEAIVAEIISSYKYIYPSAKNVLQKSLPNLPIRFKDSFLHKTFNRHGKKYFNGDYDEYKRMLIEMGVVGRVIGETERYIVGMFEYTQPHQLVVSTNDELCLHPLFTEIFTARRIENEAIFKPIYPYGSDIDGEDHRDWI
jgi:hypothetical protein